FALNGTHKATMEILLNNERAEPTVTSESTQGLSAPRAPGDAEIASQMELLKSPKLLEGVVTANNLQKQERESFTRHLHPGADEAWYIARATQHLRSKLDI